MQPRPLIVILGACMLTALSCAKGSFTSGEGGSGGSGGGNPTGSSKASSSASSSATASSSSSAASSSSSGMACAENPCKLTLPQCGCAQGEQCSANATGRLCVPTGMVGIGQVCGGANTCAPGGLCVQTSPQVSTCGEFCATDAECTAPGGLCIRTLNDGMGGSVPNVLLCTENCDPSTNTGCAAGSACQIAQEQMGQMRLLTFCTATGAGTQSSMCSTNANCAPTFGCNGLDPNMNKICLKWCKKNAPSCPVGTTCTSFPNPPLVLGGTEYGACL